MFGSSTSCEIKDTTGYVKTAHLNVADDEMRNLQRCTFLYRLRKTTHITPIAPKLDVQHTSDNRLMHVFVISTYFDSNRCSTKHIGKKFKHTHTHKTSTMHVQHLILLCTMQVCSLSKQVPYFNINVNFDFT